MLEQLFLGLDGNDIVLYTESTGASAYDTWKTANAPGSNPDDDTDGDGLPDGKELARWDDYDDNLNTNMLWKVDMAGAYGALPNPTAFPVPRQADFDRDFRDDSREKDNLTSPTAWNTLTRWW